MGCVQQEKKNPSPNFGRRFSRRTQLTEQQQQCSIYSGRLITYAKKIKITKNNLRKRYVLKVEPGRRPNVFQPWVWSVTSNE